MAGDESAPLPFEGLRVLDLARIISGPLVGQIFADLGADVIKVETPKGGDSTRGYVAQGDTEERAPLWWSLNRNKRSVVADFKDPDGVEFFKKLVASSDIVVHNFRAGVMERLGLSFSDLIKVNPRLIYCSITGFGDVGPLRTRAANDVIVQAYGGAMSYTGPVGGAPVRSGASIADFTCGLYATIGIMTALRERDRTGEGQEVKTSLLEGQLNLVAHNLVEYWVNGLVPEPMGSGTRMGLPNEAFPASNGSVLLAAVNDDAYARLCNCIGMPELATDPRFEDLVDRRVNRDILFGLISEWTTARTVAECVAELDAAGIPCGPVNNLEQVAHDPQFEALEITQDVTNFRGQPQRLIKLPFRINGRRTKVRHAAPALGADTDEIRKELGL